MKIPTKIDKRKFNSLSKTNLKELKGIIEDTNGDLHIEADWLANDWDPDNKFMKELSEEHKETTEYWQKEVKAAFRKFRSNKIKIVRAYKKYLEGKSK